MHTAITENTLQRGAVALVALLVVLGTVSGVAVAAGTTDITVSAAETTLAPGETTEVTVAVSDADGGVGSADLRVETSDPSVVTIQDVTVEADAGLQNVRGDETGQNVNFAVADTESDAGEVVFLTVTVEAVADGTADINVVDNPEDVVDGVNVADEAANSYTIENIGNATVSVESPDPANFQVSNLDAPESATQGDNITVSANVTNDGDEEATQTVGFRLDANGNGTLEEDETLATEDVTLNPGESTTATFENIDTSGLDAGDYTHGVVTENDSATATVAIEEPEPDPADFQVSNLSAPATATQGENITVSADVENTGGQSANKSVEFRVDTDGDGSIDDESALASQDVELAPGESTTVEFTDIDTSGRSGTLTHGVFTVDDTETAQITVNEPAAANFQVSNLQAPENATQGDAIDVSADVENTGEQTATKPVEFRVDENDDGLGDAGDVVLSQNVELAGGESTTVEFTDVDTSGLDAGDYTHGVVTDDDSATATISINEEPTASETSVSLSPESSEVVVDRNETYDVVVDNADGGVGAYELTVSLDNSSVASVTDVELGGGPDAKTQNVTFADDGSSVSVSAALANTSDTGSVTIASVTVEGVAEGSSDLSVDVQALGNEEGDSYTITDENGASISVVEIPPVGDFQNSPTDPDDDGLYEDVNGDGQFNIVDVQALFANLDDETIENYPDAFDFNGDGTVNVVDVQKLFTEVPDQ